MAFSWSTFHSAAALVCLWAGAVAQAAPAAPGESIRGRGVVAGQAPGPALFLVGEVHRCGGEAALPEAQLFVSADGGQSWEKRGPALAGSELSFARVLGGKLWAAGAHTAEGPAVDPFVLVPKADATAPDWTASPIAEGPAELVDVSVGGNQLAAHARRTGPTGEKTPGGPQLFVSQDGGRTWAAAKPGRNAGRPARQKLPRLTTRSGPWRLVDRKDGGFDLQKRDGRGWSTVKAFPWTPCPAS